MNHVLWSLLCKFIVVFIDDMLVYSMSLSSHILHLESLICKDQFSWHSEAQRAFDKLKQLMTEASILSTQDFTSPFTMEIDALSTTMGVILL